MTIMMIKVMMIVMLINNCWYGNRYNGRR